MDKNIDDLFVLAQKYKPLSVGIEITGQQEGFIPLFFDIVLNNCELSMIIMLLD